MVMHKKRSLSVLSDTLTVPDQIVLKFRIGVRTGGQLPHITRNQTAMPIGLKANEVLLQAAYQRICKKCPNLADK